MRPEAYAVWAAAEAAEGPSAEPVAVWADRDGSDWVDRYTDRAVGPTLIWAESRALQDEVASRLACPRFREGARSEDGTYLGDYRGDLAVASIDACYQSLNLQHFSHNLVLEPPSDPEIWKQLIGRTARQGQQAPRVTCDIVVNCRSAERALRSAIDRANLVYEMTGKRNPLLSLPKGAL